MFTGIIEETGTLARVQHRQNGYDLTVQARKVLADTQLGDSIALNGTCLTVTRLTAGAFTVGLSPETRSRTNLGYLHEGQLINLERSLTPTSRIGGHFVQGHIDGVGTVTGFRPDEDALWVTVAVPAQLMRYIVPKGFIALDGVSLTVVDVTNDSFTVTLIAYTQQYITLPRQQIGYKVNIEVDVLGKYVEKLISQRLVGPGRITPEFLAEHGYL